MGASKAEEVLPDIDQQLKRMIYLIERTRGVVSFEVQSTVAPLAAPDLDEVRQALTQNFPDLEISDLESCLLDVLIPTEHLIQLLSALCENAVEQQASELVFQATPAGMVITDNGNPFTDQTQQEALRPFYSSKEEGVGLGLNLVICIAEAYGGSFELVPCQQKKRAHFILSLPR